MPVTLLFLSHFSLYLWHFLFSGQVRLTAAASRGESFCVIRLVWDILARASVSVRACVLSSEAHVCTLVFICCMKCREQRKVMLGCMRSSAGDCSCVSCSFLFSRPQHEPGTGINTLRVSVCVWHVDIWRGERPRQRGSSTDHCYQGTESSQEVSSEEIQLQLQTNNGQHITAKLWGFYLLTLT